MPPGYGPILRERFGFRALRPLQKQIVDHVLGGKDALVVMPTGSGKSLCYQLPALALPQEGVTLVFSPLIALMEDQVVALKAKGVKAEYINSTLSKRERDRRAKRLAEGKYELIYATPERMQKPEFTDALAAVPGGVKLLAVDECHCISSWGHDLRPAYQRVGRFRAALGKPTTIALTATATRAVRTDVRRTLGLTPAAMPLFAAPVERSNLSMDVVPLWDDDEKLEQICAVSTPRGRKRGTGIVYFARIMDLERIGDQLRKRLDKRPIEIYHGKLAPREKKKVYDRFMKAEPAEGLILLATNAFGMGVDKADIRYIIHAQMPGSVESYYQEIGRAGRDGRKSRCVMLYAADDLAIQQQFAEWANPDADLLVRTAHAIEDSPHADFDLEELHLLVAGKSRSVQRAKIEYTITALEKRGIIERTSMIDRYRFVRPIEHGEVDAKAIDRKKQRDLRRLLDVVKLAKCKDLPAFIDKYFDLSEERPSRKKTAKKKSRRRGGRGRRGGSAQRGGGSAQRGGGSAQRGGAPTANAPRPEDDSGPTKKRRRRRRRSASAAAKPAPTESGNEAKPPAARRRRRRRRRSKRPPSA